MKQLAEAAKQGIVQPGKEAAPASQLWGGAMDMYRRENK
jgi:hypothetical protein